MEPWNIVDLFFFVNPSFSGSIVEFGLCVSHDVMISGMRRGPKRFGVEGSSLCFFEKLEIAKLFF